MERAKRKKEIKEIRLIRLALRYERRHLPFRTWYHKRREGGGAAESGDTFCIAMSGQTTDEILMAGAATCILKSGH